MAPDTETEIKMLYLIKLDKIENVIISSTQLQNHYSIGLALI